jgi:hypothetical protein
VNGIPCRTSSSGSADVASPDVRPARHPASDDPDDCSGIEDAVEVRAPPITGRAGLADRGCVPVCSHRHVSRASRKHLSIPGPLFPFGPPARAPDGASQP